MNDLIDIKMTKGYKDNVVLFNSLDLACNEVKNVIMSDIVFEGYKPSMGELRRIVSNKINSLYEEVTPQILENSKSSYKEMYFNNEDKKVMAVLKEKGEEDKYPEFQIKLEESLDTQERILREKFSEIKSGVIVTITNDCYSLIHEQVPLKDLEKMEKK